MSGDVSTVELLGQATARGEDENDASDAHPLLPHVPAALVLGMTSTHAPASGEASVGADGSAGVERKAGTGGSLVSKFSLFAESYGGQQLSALTLAHGSSSDPRSGRRLLTVAPHGEGMAMAGRLVLTGGRLSPGTASYGSGSVPASPGPELSLMVPTEESENAGADGNTPPASVARGAVLTSSLRSGSGGTMLHMLPLTLRASSTNVVGRMIVGNSDFVEGDGATGENSGEAKGQESRAATASLAVGGPVFVKGSLRVLGSAEVQGVVHDSSGLTDSRIMSDVVAVAAAELGGTGDSSNGGEDDAASGENSAHQLLDKVRCDVPCSQGAGMT